MPSVRKPSSRTPIGNVIFAGLPGIIAGIIFLGIALLGPPPIDTEGRSVRPDSTYSVRYGGTPEYTQSGQSMISGQTTAGFLVAFACFMYGGFRIYQSLKGQGRP